MRTDLAPSSSTSPIAPPVDQAATETDLQAMLTSLDELADSFEGLIERLSSVDRPNHTLPLMEA